MTNTQRMESAKDMLAEKLMAIKRDITQKDRNEAVLELETNHVTITKYLKGDVPKPDFGLKLYEFFHGKVRGRIDQINAVDQEPLENNQAQA